ncbi:MAG: hypothetical protein PVJ34_09300, partial [Anaerolineae bacterium]
MSTSVMSQKQASRLARRGSRLGRWLQGGITASGILGYVFLYAPIVILVIFSFNTSRFVTSWE